MIADGFHILGAQSNGGALSADGTVMAGSLEKSINYSVWDTVGSVSGGGAVDGDPPDRITTTQVAGALDKALDEHGDRFAVMIDGAIYVSDVRAPGELPQSPTALLGAGAINEETLAFRGDTVVSGTGDFALVWDLAQSGRLGEEFTATIPEGCGACGPQRIELDAAGTRALLTVKGGDGPVVVDLESGDSHIIATEGTLACVAAAWWDDDRVVVASIAENALLVASADLMRPSRRPPPPVEATVLRSSAAGDGSRTVLAEDGTSRDAGRGRPSAYHTEHRFRGADGEATPLATTSPPIRPPRSSVTDVTDGLSSSTLATGETVFEATAPTGAAYDGDSRLHVFAEGERVDARPVDRRAGGGAARRSRGHPPAGAQPRRLHRRLRRDRPG